MTAHLHINPACIVRNVDSYSWHHPSMLSGAARSLRWNSWSLNPLTRSCVLLVTLKIFFNIYVTKQFYNSWYAGLYSTVCNWNDVQLTQTLYVTSQSSFFFFQNRVCRRRCRCQESPPCHAVRSSSQDSVGAGFEPSLSGTTRLSSPICRRIRNAGHHCYILNRPRRIDIHTYNM